MSYETEQALLGCLLNNNRSFELVAHMEPHHFNRLEHRLIYNAMHKRLKKGGSIDTIVLMSDLNRLGELDECGGMTYLNEVTTCACSASNAALYADIVMESYRANELRHIGIEMIANLTEKKQSFEIIEEVSKRIEQISSNEQEQTLFDMTESMSEHVELINARMNGEIKFIPTGLKDLDKKLGGGMSGGELIVLAARPSMGKTACSLSIALNVAKTQNVLFFSMEMKRSLLVERCVANIGNIALGWLRDPKPEHDENCGKHSEANLELCKRGLFIDDKAARRALDMMTIAKQLNRKKQLSLIVVDYLGLMSGGNKDNRNLELGEYTKGLKALAKDLDCPVLLLAQLNRKVDDRASRKPMMSDLRDSGEIENDADTIMFLYREDYYDKSTVGKGLCEIDITKQRQGETGSVMVSFKAQYQRFEDLNYEYEWDKPQPMKTKRSKGFKNSND